jgi:hypothetical protein
VVHLCLHQLWEDGHTQKQCVFENNYIAVWTAQDRRSTNHLTSQTTMHLRVHFCDSASRLAQTNYPHFKDDKGPSRQTYPLGIS